MRRVPPAPAPAPSRCPRPCPEIQFNAKLTYCRPQSIRMGPSLPAALPMRRPTSRRPSSLGYAGPGLLWGLLQCVGRLQRGHGGRAGVAARADQRRGAGGSECMGPAGVACVRTAVVCKGFPDEESRPLTHDPTPEHATRLKAGGVGS